MLKPFKFYVLSFAAILIFSFVVLYPSFNLAFEDEEWQGIVLPKTIYASYVTSRITAYSSPMWFMTNLYSFLGPNFFPYFILSFVLRNLLAFSVVILLYILTKNRLASFLGGILITFGFSGIQTTFEIINMISYISLIGLLIFLCAFFKTSDRLSVKYLAAMGISLMLATILASFRIYPVYVWVFIVDSWRVLTYFKNDIIKPFLVRQSIILIVFLFLYKIGIFSWYTRDVPLEKGMNDVSRFISDALTLLAGLNLNIAANFLKGLGNIIFPDILDKSGIISLLLGAIFVIIFISLLIYGIKKRTRGIYLLLAFLLWPLLFYTSYFLIYINSGLKDTAIFHSQIRYLFPPFIGFVIALAIFLSIVQKMNNKLNRVVLGFIIVFIFIHALSTHTFLSKLSQHRDGFYMVAIWKQIKQLVPESNLDTKKMNVFYFETDGSARAIYTVNDGFIGHAIALYKIDSKPPKVDSKEISSFGRLLAPPIITYEELVSYIEISLSDNPELDIWNRVFALKVEGDRVIDIKEDVKIRVEASLNK